MERRRQLAVHLIEILVLAAFAVAQPLYDLLSRHVEFFVTWQSGPVDILLLIACVSLVLPAGLFLLELGGLAVGPTQHRGVHRGVIAILVATIVLPALKRMPGVPGVASLAIALFLGALASLSYGRFKAVPIFLLWLLPAAFFFPAFFLFSSPVYKIAFGTQSLGPVTPKLPNGPPIIMVIFDEFPLVSLLDEHRQIDPNRYPNFAAFARGANWYRNASTVSEGTLNAVPAILDGQYPRPDLQRLPNATDHPHSLFTLLAGSYKFNVVENNTRLCPDSLCEDGAKKTPLSQRMRGLLRDVGILYLYLLLPKDLTKGLPDISHSWRDFRSASTQPSQAASSWLEYDRMANWDHRIGVFKDFIRSIHPSPKPSLNFLHVLLPHAIWEFLPSGKKYTLPEQGIRGVRGTNDSGEDPNRWTKDRWTVIQSYQRHLLQVGLVDRLTGELVDHLKAVGLYDPALIIIAADHGASFRPDDSRRSVTPTNYPDIMAIPFFIKWPQQQQGMISDDNVETIDLLPTIAEVLKIELPWRVDGHSLLSPTAAEKPHKTIFSDTGARFIFDVGMEAKWEALEQKLRLFGSGSEPDGLFRIGSHSELIGCSSPSGHVVTEQRTRCHIDADAYFDNVDLNAPIVLTQISGRILRPRNGTFRPLNLALAVNGKVSAMTESYKTSQEERFSALVPESVLRQGRNEVELCLVSTDHGQPVLARIPKMKALQ
jgi:hypothetical protein